jgi:FlaA1/EpsC-like NDP-sugar epimerase
MDSLVVAGATVIAGAARVDAAQMNGTGLVRLIALVVIVHALTGLAVGLYRGRWENGSFDEMAGVAATAASTGALLIGIDMVSPHVAPIPVLVASTVLLLISTGGVRFASRMMSDRGQRRSARGPHRVVVVGAGDGGSQIVRAMLRKQGSEYQPVTLIDDDPRKQNLRIMGVPVVGPRSAIPKAVRGYGADTVLLAVPSANAPLVREVSDLATAAGASFRLLPPVSELIEGRVRISDIRPVSYTDLLGRGEVTTDVKLVSSYLTHKRVLVTGAGGSIGSELCRQLAEHDLEQLVMLDRDESGLHAVQLSIEGRALLDDSNLVVADIRDRQRLFEVFSQHEPDVVFHAAALKHLTLLEQHPTEAIKTNVFGTQNVLDAARSVGASHMVNISTDKAADPISVLGWSKRIAERLTAQAAGCTEGTFVSVRFGNVLGSRGSVIPAFQTQIAAGGPVTVTDERVTRYFMTTREAVRLVIHAGAIGGKGETLVLDMGQQVAIVDLARRLIDLSGRPIDIVFTGLRAGEKLGESLLGADEQDLRPVHPMIVHVAVPPLTPSQLEPLTENLSRRGACAALRQLTTARPEYIDLDERTPRSSGGLELSNAM